jgi:hypothetical protein
MSKIIKTSLLFFSLMQASCAYKNNINKHLDGRKVVEITADNKTPKSNFVTPSDGILVGVGGGGLVGATVAYSMANNEIANIRHASDPANFIKKEVGEALKTKYGFQIVDKKKLPDTEVKTIDYLLLNYDDGDLVLDANSTIMASYYPFRWSYYRVTYISLIKLVDRRTKSVIYKSQCTYNDKKDNAHTLDQIAKNPNVMSVIFEYAQKFCSEKFTREILSN